MGTAKLTGAIETLNGKLAKGDVIFRIKKFKDDEGRIIGYGKQEFYKPLFPRDYKRTPPKGAELEHLKRFGTAALMTTEILYADRPEPEKPEPTTAYTLSQRPHILSHEEALDRLQDYRRRFKAQLYTTPNSKPDPNAKFDPKSQTRLRYSRFDNFVRAMVFYELRQKDTKTPSSLTSSTEH